MSNPPPIIPLPTLGYESYQPDRRFRSGHGLAIATITGLAVACFVALMAAGSDYLQLGMLNQIQAHTVTKAQAQMNDVRQSIVAVIYLLCILATAVLFWIWLHRVYKNLPAITGRRTEHTPGWAVGCFFVPVLNLFRPYQVLKEVLVGSDRTGKSSGSIAGWWWGTWILGGLIGRFSSAFVSGPPDIEQLMSGTQVSIFDHLFALVPGVLAIIMIRAIDRTQAGSGRASEMTPMTPVPVTEPAPSLISVAPPPSGRRNVDRA